MKQLLESKDLLKEERVIMAYKTLCPNKWSDAWNHIHYSLADVAFQMRDAYCTDLIKTTEWLGELSELVEQTNYTTVTATPSLWIIAATLAWEHRNE